MLTEETTKELLEFRRARQWSQFHTTKNLSIALTIEAAELLEIFQWASDADLKTLVSQRRKDIEREVADVAILLAYLCNDLHIDVDKCVKEKLVENEKKYPIHKSRGLATKYDQL